MIQILKDFSKRKMLVFISIIILVVMNILVEEKNLLTCFHLNDFKKYFKIQSLHL